MIEYRERVRRKYEELEAKKGTVEGEWRQYKDAFVGVVEELCGRTSGKGGTPRSRNQGWWTEEVAKAVGEKWEAWKMIEGIRDRGEQPLTGLKHLYGQKKKAARRAVDRPRRSMEDELYRKLDEDGGKKVIFKMARDRTEDGRDVKRGAVIKGNNGRLITESKEVLRIWAANYKEMLNLEQEQQVASSSQARLGERWKWRRYDRKKWKQQCTRRKKARRQGQMKCG